MKEIKLFSQARKLQDYLGLLSLLLMYFTWKTEQNKTKLCPQKAKRWQLGARTQVFLLPGYHSVHCKVLIICFPWKSPSTNTYCSYLSWDFPKQKQCPTLALTNSGHGTMIWCSLSWGQIARPVFCCLALSKSFKLFPVCKMRITMAFFTIELWE